MKSRIEFEHIRGGARRRRLRRQGDFSVSGADFAVRSA